MGPSRNESASTVDPSASASRGRGRATREIGGQVACGTIVGLALLGILLVIQDGLVVTPDGRAYLDVANDIRQGRWFDDPTVIEASHFPPGLSLALAAVSAVTGLALTATAGLLNAVSLCITIAGSALYLRRQGTSPRLVLLVMVLLGASAGLLRVNVLVLTEAPFTASVVVVALALDFERRRPGPRSFMLLAMACLAAGLLRYPGLAVALGAAASIFLWHRSIQALGRAAMLLLLAAGALCVWLVVVSTSGPGELRDHSPSSDLTIAEVGHSVSALGFAILGGGYDVEGRLFGPLDAPARLGGGVLGLLVLAVLVTWVARALRDLLRHGAGAETASALAMVVASYVGFVTITRFIQGYSVLDRYWLPVIVLGLLALLGSGWALVPQRQLLLTRLLVLLIAANVLRSGLLLADRLS